jgi:sugar phosphate isomerase/epimerase
MNGHVYAGVLPAPPGSMPDLEAKVKALEPQLVRIFFSEAQEAIPARMESFVKTVELAQEAGATINITYQSAARAKNNPALFMGQFAAVLDDLVRNRGATNVRWVTIQNEPNRTQLTLPEYETLYLTLHDLLVARGLRDHIKLMGGDLVEFGELSNLPNPDHRTWWAYMAEHMNDVLDAYSVKLSRLASPSAGPRQSERACP